jgi:hypothetical protein
MQTSPYVVPVFRGMTVVGTALSRDVDGDLVHRLTTTSTVPGDPLIHYDVLSGSASASAPTVARSAHDSPSGTD